MQLFQIPPPPQDLTCTPDQAGLAERDTLLTSARAIQAVTTADDNSRCALVGSSIQGMLKGVEKARKEITTPYLEAQRTIKSTVDRFCEPLTAELTRLGRLASTYRQEQERKAELERRKRAEEILRLEEQKRQADEDARKAAEAGNLTGSLLADIAATALTVATSAAIATQPVEAPKTAGQSFQARTLGVEVLDPIALWNARPDLCNPPTPKLSAIKAVCSPEHPVPGLKLWWESKVSFKSR